MKKTVFILASILSFAVVSCKDKQATTETPETNQETTQTEVQVEKTESKLTGSWELLAVTTPAAEGKTVDQLFPNKKPSLTFSGENQLNGNDGCNNIMGEYESKENNGIAIGDKLAATKMFCEGVADTVFMQGLTSVTKYDIVGDELLFISGDIVVMKFKKAEVTE
ncbi:META domain-containing protein [Myroides albus]|uniref:META domain-containing protein n=2 Tax=Myroides TaxID=76831 RepID=A0A6I3LLZ5_9FLAO|nr:META domain-containing protein [Myroides albus]MTG98320.1 META domain-containing protein [Myroides albus]MVX36095.1 META domain-containing protein [Myroides sp. LoEW2-1]UVD79607.1 META domain-containing protein [Myroides albus]